MVKTVAKANRMTLDLPNLSMIIFKRDNPRNVPTEHQRANQRAYGYWRSPRIANSITFAKLAYKTV